MSSSGEGPRRIVPGPFCLTLHDPLGDYPGCLCTMRRNGDEVGHIDFIEFAEGQALVFVGDVRAGAAVMADAFGFLTADHWGRACHERQAIEDACAAWLRLLQEGVTGVIAS